MKKALKIIVLLVIASSIALAFFRWETKKQNGTSISPDKNSVLDPTISSPKTTDNNQSEQSALIDPAENNATMTTQDQSVPQNASSDSTIPEKYLLDIPFYSQAPLSKWDAFHEDMCEEASILNAALYLEDKKLTKDQFEVELQKIQNIEKKEIGEWKSTTIAQTKKWADIYFEGKIKSKIINSPTIEQIESEITQNNPVIVPLAGRDIGNPNFTPPGPVYHMLVVKGYDSQNFITNDVGTRKGNSYVYKKAVIMKNMHDWNEKDIHSGEKEVLVFYK